LVRRQKNLALQITWLERPIVLEDAEADIWDVPSQSNSGSYMVDLKRMTCECPNWRKHRRPCKHIYAAVIQKAKDAKKSVPELQPVPNPYKNPPYYDQIMKHADRLIGELLRCAGAQIPYVAHDPDKKARRKKTPMGDILVCAGLATRDNKPSRKFTNDPAYEEACFVSHPASPVNSARNDPDISISTIEFSLTPFFPSASSARAYRR
jgi:hypothetical protein